MNREIKNITQLLSHVEQMDAAREEFKPLLENLLKLLQNSLGRDLSSDESRIAEDSAWVIFLTVKMKRADILGGMNGS